MPNVAISPPEANPTRRSRARPVLTHFAIRGKPPLRLLAGEPVRTLCGVVARGWAVLSPVIGIVLFDDPLTCPVCAARCPAVWGIENQQTVAVRLGRVSK